MKFAAIGKVVGKAKYTLKANSPKIKVAAGIGVGVVGVVLACRATLKSKPVIDELKEDEEANRDEFGDDKKALQKAQIGSVGKAFRKTAVYWAGPVACGVGSIALILNGFGELNTRYLGAVATCSVFQKGFAEYRKRVADKIGTEEEQNLYHGIEYKDIKVQKDDSDKLTTVKKAPVVTNTLACNPFTVVFQDYDPNTQTGSERWRPKNDSNVMFVRNVQDWANRQLQLNGYLTLRDVLRELGMKPQSLLDPMMAMNYGWVYTKNNDDKSSDNYVDFGIWDAYFNYISDDAEDYAFYKKKDLFLEFNCVPLFGISSYEENKLNAYLSQR